jgi:trk system potassium uptake protein TrkH
MRLNVVINALGYLLIILGGAMLLPLLWALYYNGPDIKAFIITSFITIITGLILLKLTPPTEGIRTREGFAIVSLGWLVASLFGSIPYMLAGTFDNYADAFFETMSGFTTTGASVLTNIEVLPHGILFWRSLTHWLGGMGIIVLFIAVLSNMGYGANQMFKAESPGPVTEKIKPRIAETAKILWLTYFILSVMEIILLWLSGMNLFDSMCHTFGTMATGGFSTKNASIGHYQNPVTQWIIIVFMFMAGANFSLYYFSLRGKSLKTFWRNEEFKLYTYISLGATFLLTVVLILSDGEKILNLEQVIRTSAFQAISIITTTGYATADFDKWPLIARISLFVLMFVGGCAGSTGGSVKVGRHLVLFKAAALELRRLIHPRAILSLKVNKKNTPDEILINILIFFFIYFVIFFIGAIIMAAMGLDLITALTSVAATLGNVGPGLNKVGPTANYSFVPGFGKYFLSFLMILGRLELYTVLVLFLPSTWKN